MSRNDTRELFSHLPFVNTTNYDIGNEFSSAKFRITQLMTDHRLDKFLEGHYLSNLFDPNAKTLCNYYDEDSYADLKRDLFWCNSVDWNWSSQHFYGWALVWWLSIYAYFT